MSTERFYAYDYNFEPMSNMLYTCSNSPQKYTIHVRRGDAEEGTGWIASIVFPNKDVWETRYALTTPLAAGANAARLLQALGCKPFDESVDAIKVSTHTHTPINTPTMDERAVTALERIVYLLERQEIKPGVLERIADGLDRAFPQTPQSSPYMPPYYPPPHWKW